MTALWQFGVGERVWEAATYYDDGDNPIAREGPSSYERGERAAEAFARSALRGRRSERPGAFWYATIRRGQVADPVGEGRPHDHVFEPDPDWSRTILDDGGGCAERTAPGQSDPRRPGGRPMRSPRALGPIPAHEVDTGPGREPTRRGRAAAGCLSVTRARRA